MSSVHAQLANTLVLFYGLLGLWGVLLGVARKPMNGSYRGALYLAVGVGVLQLVVGVVLLLTGPPPANATHYLYGLSVIVTLPLVHQYLAGKVLPDPLAYGLGCLFMAGLALRAITTGR